jgi:hypothetical protein
MSAPRTRRWRRRPLPANPGQRPHVWLSTSYGTVRLLALEADIVEVNGQLLINNVEHTLKATLCRRDQRSPFHLGAEHDDPRRPEERARELELRRAWDMPAASDSARRKAAIEIDRTVAEWAATPQASAMLRDAAKHERRLTAHMIGIAIGEAGARERKARRERLQAVSALHDLTPDGDPAYSPLSPAQAIKVYRGRILAAVCVLRGQISSGQASEVETGLDQLEALAQLALPAAGRGTDPKLWDALTALLEAERG